MEVGYLPDMFGHIAQMPQILRLAGFEHAVVWRGVPSVIDETGFWWEAPDGSSVRAEYLPTGYGNGAAIPDDAKALVRRVADHEQEIGELPPRRPAVHERHRPPGAPALARAGGGRSQRAPGRLRARGDHAARLPGRRPHRGPATLEGRAALGGAGQRPHGRGVEPGRREAGGGAGRAGPRAPGRAAQCAVPAAPRRGPRRLLDVAWREMVRNAAHDSICACSVDEVVDAVLVRYAEATASATGWPTRRSWPWPGRWPTPGPTVVNVSARPRAGVVEVVVAGDEVPAGTQALPEEPGAFGIPRGLGALTLDATTVRTILGMLPNGSQIDAHTWIQGVHVEEDESGIDITIAFGSEERFDVPIASIKQDLYTRLGARPDSMVRIKIDQPPVRRVLARVDDVPGFGYRPLEPVVPAHPVTVDGEAGDGPVGHGQRARHGGRRPRRRHLRHRRRGRLRPARRRRRPRRLLQLLTPGRGPHRGHPRQRGGDGGRARAGPRASCIMAAHYTWPDHVDGMTRAAHGRGGASR